MLTQQSECFKSFIEFNTNHPLKKHFMPTYYQLGFICSVQALPEHIDLELWLAFLWQGDVAMTFASEEQATEYAENVLRLVEVLQLSYQQALPLTAMNSKGWIDDNKIVSDNGKEFCAGFIRAIEVFNEHWLILDQEPEAQNILQTVILLLSKIAPTENCEESLIAIFDQLPSATEIVEILPKLISNLAYTSSQINISDEAV